MALKLSNKMIAQLRDYVMTHEQDIANGINDFDDLHDIFVLITGRSPEA